MPLTSFATTSSGLWVGLLSPGITIAFRPQIARRTGGRTAGKIARVDVLDEARAVRFGNVVDDDASDPLEGDDVLNSTDVTPGISLRLVRPDNCSQGVEVWLRGCGMMVTRQSLGLLALASVLFLGGSADPVLAKGNKHGNGKQKNELRAGSTVVVVDRDGHRRIVNEYFTREGLPPGLAKRGSLPPGLRRQLRERGHLPPGLQKRLEPLPPGLGQRLPSVPPYYHRYLADHDLIVLDSRTNRIVAVIPGVRP